MLTFLKYILFFGFCSYLYDYLPCIWGFPGRFSLVAQLVKNSPATWETWVQFLGWEDPLEKRKATYSVFWPGGFHGLYSPWSQSQTLSDFHSHTNIPGTSAGKESHLQCRRPRFNSWVRKILFIYSGFNFCSLISLKSFIFIVKAFNAVYFSLGMYLAASH